MILSVQVRLSATSLSEVALKVWQAPCTLSASVGPASQTELSASAALALCVLWDAAKRTGPPATQEALDWGTCLDVGAVTRVLSYRKKRIRFGGPSTMRPPLTSM